MNFVVQAGEEIVLDDAVAVGRVGEFQPENLRVFFRLLEAVTGGSVHCLRFDTAMGKSLR